MAIPKIRYERIFSGPSDPVKAADEQLENGWTSRRGVQVDLHSDIAWDNASERTLAFNIHAWNMIDALLRAYDLTGKTSYLAPAFRIADDWVRKYPRSDSASHDESFAWYDMSVGYRSYRLAYIFEAAQSDGLLNDADAETWRQRMLEHADFLADDANIAMHSNHGFYQVAGQIAMARRLASEGGPYPELERQGHERLALMLDQQFGPNGVHMEHSPDYHRMVYETVHGLIDAHILSSEAVDRVAAIEQSLAWFVCPDGTIANFGDSDARQLTVKARHAAKRWQTEAMRFAVTVGEIGKRPLEVLRQFPGEGYAVIRQPFPGESADRDSYLAFNAAFHSRTHKHADDLSFVWHEFGRPILIDAGRFGYVKKSVAGSDIWKEGFWYADPSRMFVERTRAHNCLEFDGRDYLRKGRKPFGSALKGASRNDDLTVMRGEVRQFQTIRHTRTLLILPRQWLVVLDAWWSAAGQPETHPRQWFQFDPDIAVEAAEPGFVAALPGDRPPLRVVPLQVQTQQSQPIRGQAEPLQGWWSPAELVLEPATSIWFDPVPGNVGHVATLFAFGESAVAEPQLGRVATLARSGRLAFEIDGGRWQIDIATDDDEVPAAKITRRPS